MAGELWGVSGLALGPVCTSGLEQNSWLQPLLKFAADVLRAVVLSNLKSQTLLKPKLERNMGH